MVDDKIISQKSSTESFNKPNRKSGTRSLFPFNTNDIKVLLLENINEAAVEVFKQQGYQVMRYLLLRKNTWYTDI